MKFPLNKTQLKAAVGMAVFVLASTNALAEKTDFDFAGFASLAYGKAISDKKEGSMYALNADGEYRDFNKLGFRLNADMHNNLTFTAQLLAQGADDYQPTFDWIFATYQLNPELAVSVGRIRVPVFMYSDTLDTSYAYPWIEPPKSVYNLSQTPFKSMEGVKFAYTTMMADWSSELLVFTGHAQDRFTESGVDADLILENATGVAWTVGYDWLSLRAFYFQADTSLDITTNSDIKTLITAVTAVQTSARTELGSSKVNLTDALLWEKDPGAFYGLGASLDFQQVFIITELTSINVKGDDSNFVTPNMYSAYVTAGVRLPSDWSLSLTYLRDIDHANKKTWKQFNPVIAQLSQLPPSVSIATLIAQLQGTQTAVEKEVKNQQDYSSKGLTLAARWDFHPSASFKAEYLVEERAYGSAKSKIPQAVRIGLDFAF